MSNKSDEPNLFVVNDQGVPVLKVERSPTDKPTSMLIFGILSLIFGAMGVLGLATFVVQYFVEFPQDENLLTEVLNSPAYKNVMAATQVIGIPLLVIQIIAGIGLLRGKAYGPRMAIIHAIAYLIFALVGSILAVVLVALPVLERVDELPDSPEKFIFMGTAYMMFIQPLWLFIYPALTLFFMTRPAIKNYLIATGQRSQNA